ncbi:MAG: hypothetical protein Q4B73_04465 [Lachnospiraceae bacterium]|nr:hypothetical protein [Lachnospiraceae bacterium]
MNEMKSRRILGFPDEFWIGFVIMIGIFLKLVYNVSVGYEVCGHNPGEWTAIINDIPNGGHIGYIQYLYVYHRLPSFDPSLIPGYTQQPLFYIFSAVVLQIFHGFMGWNLGSVLHCIQCVNFVFVLVGTFSGVGILGRMGVKGRKKVMLLLFLMFYPGLYNLGAALDNTPMAFMFGMLAMGKALKWYETRKRGVAISCGVMLGMALMAKFSAFVVIFPIGALFVLARFYDRRGSDKVLYQHMGLVAGISLPMGLWYPIRNLVKFGTSPFYTVPEAAVWQDVSGYSFFQRLRLPKLEELSQLHLTPNTFYEYNIWSQTFKTTVVDEYALNVENVGPHFLAVFLVVSVIFFAILALVMLVQTLTANRMQFENKIFVLTGTVVFFVIYIIHCFANPTVSAMNAREIPFMIFFLCIGVGMCGSATPRDTIFEKVTTYMAHMLIVVISMLSAFLFGFYAI